MDIKRIKNKLIQLFAENSVTEIEKDGKKLLKNTLGTGRYRQLIKKSEFTGCLENLKELRDDLDLVLEDEEGIRQVKDCLGWLQDKKVIADKNLDPEYFRLAVKLLEQIIDAKWNQEECAYFDRGMQMLVEWKDFFISYTNRKFNATNSQFEELLHRILDPDIYEENINSKNCVAQLLFDYLDQHTLTCFFDQNNLTCGDKLKEEIFKHCTSVYVFIQLVGLPTLYYKDGSINWCHLEFKRFDEWVEETGTHQSGRFQFVLTGEKEEVFPKRLHPSYKKWKNRIDEHVFIENLAGCNRKKLEKTMGELANAIIETREKMLTDYFS